MPLAATRAMSTVAPAVAHSPLAQSLGALRLSGGKRKVPIFGMCVHTTGSGPAEFARKHPGTTALARATDFYLARGNFAGSKEGFPHYVIGYDGQIWLICPETHVAWHAGWKGGRARWSNWVAPTWWSSVWNPKGARSPVDLMGPNASGPNSAHIGVELLGSESGRQFTPQQYDALARLVVDVFRRNGLTLSVPPNRQLLGHEDVDPISRQNKYGGWDPGAHRTNPAFSWAMLWSRIQAVGGSAPPPIAPAPPPAPSTTPVSTGSWTMFRSVAGVARAIAAFTAGERDPNKLTNIIFHARHPELGGRSIRRDETALAQEWRWIRTNIVEPALRNAAATGAPAQSAGATPAAAQFLRNVPSAQRWRALLPLLDRHRGDIPIEFLLGWIAVESDARIDSHTNLDERGFFQLMPSESQDARPPIQHQRLSTDPEYSVQAGIQIVRYYAGLARQRYPFVQPGSELFWRIVKLQHAMGGGLVRILLNAMRAKGIPVTWENIKRFEVSDGPPLHRLLRVRPGRFGHNVDEVYERGRAVARSLGR